MSTLEVAELLEGLLRAQRLERAQSRALFEALVRGELSEHQLVALVVALKVRGETPEEIAGAVEALRAHALPFPRPDYEFADLVGTGGDGAGTINISTAATVVAAEAGLPMVKHGNRSASSRCGSADVLERLGVKIDMAPATARRAVDELGLSFLYAPLYHAGLRHAAATRRALATRTIFNLIGPLVNPARPSTMLVGVYDAGLCRLVAETLALTGVTRALVVHGLGLDEIALHGRTEAVELIDGRIGARSFVPADFGAAELPLARIQGGTPEDNAGALTALLGGRGDEGHRAAVAVNAGALLYLAGRAGSPAAGYAKAQEVLAGDGALRRLQALARLSNEGGDVGSR